MARKASHLYVDTDVLMRFLTGDDVRKQKASADLFEDVARGKLILKAPDTVIADTVFVLSSPRLYNLPRTQIRDILTTLLRIPNFKVENKQSLLDALDLYAGSNLDFGDALLITFIRKSNDKKVYSYDHDFDRIPGITRIEP
ncbi:MAG: PIN domain-containing protein [bacterium]|nr:PIN domain-containing protein [bacterium]